MDKCDVFLFFESCMKTFSEVYLQVLWANLWFGHRPASLDSPSVGVAGNINDLVFKMELNNKYQELTHYFITNFSWQQSISQSQIFFSLLYLCLMWRILCIIVRNEWKILLMSQIETSLQCKLYSFLFNIHLLIRYFIMDWVNASDEVKSHHPGFKVKFIIFVLRTRQRKCVAWPTLKVWEGAILPSAMNSMFKNGREMQPVDLLPNKLVHCGETDSSVCMNFSLW